MSAAVGRLPQGSRSKVVAVEGDEKRQAELVEETLQKNDTGDASEQCRSLGALRFFAASP